MRESQRSGKAIGVIGWLERRRSALMELLSGQGPPLLMSSATKRATLLRLEQLVGDRRLFQAGKVCHQVFGSRAVRMRHPDGMLRTAR